MATHPLPSSSFLPCACLPFVELAHESVIEFGPVIFWPASKWESFVSKESASCFIEYIQKITHIKASPMQKESLVDTVTLSLPRTTCISIVQEVPNEVYEFLLVDSLYLLYFTCTFRSLYYGQEVPPFQAFRKMIPASEGFFKDKNNWRNLHIFEADREETVCLHLIDPEICQGLGRALQSIYQPCQVQDEELAQNYKRIVRSIRYLVDRFFQRFVNLFGNGLHFSEEIFEPEDVIFLASSFETLFHIDNPQEVAADFKHRLRPLLHLKYSRPLEMFWKWVDDFYTVKRRILKGDTFLEPLFRANPNFEVSHILLGIKLFVYAIYYYLFKCKLLTSTYEDPYTPPDFKWIHPEEVLLFFWTEPAVIEKIGQLMKQGEERGLKEEILADLNLLTTLFVALYDRYYLSQQIQKDAMLRFIPSPLADLKEGGDFLVKKIKELEEKNSDSLLLKSIHPYFLQTLEDRLQEKQMQVRSLGHGSNL